MEKTITNEWNWNEPSLSFYNPTPANNDIIIKKASWYSNIKPEDGFIFVSALFLGACEAYGPNANGDAFKEEDLIKCHHSFVKGARFYKHHKNRADVDPDYGTVVATWYNPSMRRVEGIIKIDVNKAPETVEKIKKGINVPLSMACRVKYDVCSKCGHKARNTKEYCDHAKYQMGEILEDGTQVCVYNPDPDFFDISEVYRGADRTAYTFRKVASIDNNMLEIQKRPVYNTIDKKAILIRLAEMEKEIEGLAIGEKQLRAKSLPKRESLDIDTDNEIDTKKKIGKVAQAGAAITVDDISGLHSNTGNISNTNMFRSLLKSGCQYLDKIPQVSLELGLPPDKYSICTGHLTKRAFLNYDVEYKPYHKTGNVFLKVAALNLSAIYSNPSLIEDRNFCENLILCQQMAGVI